MKLVQTEKTFQTNADFTSQDFTIGDVSVVIDILRNKLYRHKIRTLVQEYISNARDATREINSKKPIEITVPTMFSPTFKVRDFGPGISPDRMYNVFIKYASSTKRNSNKQTGGFGIGAKSAWSYTESFTIVTFIDGVQRTYVAHIGANNNGRLDYLGESKTTQPNGTEIQIAVSPGDVSEFKKSALRAVFFWNNKEKPLFVNMVKDDIKQYEPGTFVAKNAEINKHLPDSIVTSWDHGIVLSIDGIPYFLSESLLEKTPSLEKLHGLISGRLVIHLKNGDVEVSASREEISDSKYTIDALEEIGKQLLNEVETNIKAEFAKAKNPFEHLSVYMSLNDTYKLEDYRQCGEFTVTDDNLIQSGLFESVDVNNCIIESPKNEMVKHKIFRSERRYYRRSKQGIKAEWFNRLYFVDTSEQMVITNYRIKTFLKTNPNIVVFSLKDNCTQEFDKIKTALGLKDIKTIAYDKPDRKTREVQKIERTKQEFCLHRLDRFYRKTINTSLETNTTKWLYVEKSGISTWGELINVSTFLFETEGWKICALSKDAINRVKGDKNFKPLSEFWKTYSLKQKQIESLKYHASKEGHVMIQLKKVKNIKDKFLSKMVEEYKTFSSSNTVVPDYVTNIVGTIDEVEDFKKQDKLLTEKINTEYSLLRAIEWSQKNAHEEISFYLNAK